MKRKTIVLLLTLVMVFSMSSSAFAEHMTGGDSWEVVFKNDDVESTFGGDEFADVLEGLQPGDDLTIKVKVKNEGGKTVDWYMQNEILETLEDAKEGAFGGGYTFILKYIDTKGEEKEIYNSNTVGGEGQGEAPVEPAEPSEGDEPAEENTEGLHEVDSALKEYMFLERMDTGKEGEVELYIALEGESQINSYQDTVAALRMRFAVEIVPTKTVITGDAASKGMTPLYIIAGISGLLIIALVLTGELKGKKKAKKVMVLILALCMIFAQVHMSYADTSYRVRVYGGNEEIGKLLAGEENVYTEEVAFDTETGTYGTFEFDLAQVEIVDERFFAKGLKVSGKDNSTYLTGPLTIYRDSDYVIAYGMKENMVTYTVTYLDENGDPFLDENGDPIEETFYGNVGDKPVVAFRYFEGYQPVDQALTGTLSADPTENVFTFEYKVTEPITTEIIIPGGGGQGGQGGQGQGGQQGGEGQEGGDNPSPAPGPNPTPTPTPTPPDPTDIDDPEPPLDPGKKGFPIWGVAAGGAGLLALILIPIIIKRRKDDEDEDEDDE